MRPTDNQRRAAEALKAEGNTLFAKGRYLPAAECYTEAITLVPADPAFATLYVNRAMCYKKAGGRWPAVVADASTALGLEPGLMKAHYLLGVAQRELEALPAAISHLSKALEAAREKGDAIKDEIWRELARAKYASWQQESQQRTAAAVALQQQLDALLRCQQCPGCAQPEAFGGSIAAADGGGAEQGSGGQPKLQQLVQEQWQALFERAAHLDARTEVPSHLLCPLTMEVYREPVITPGGFSYERSALLDHLKRVGRWDPISRAPLSESDLVTNVGLRNAVHHFLDEHPWAWHECI